ncbi:MAG: hypothetical protein R2912_10840 [Eubacteriales bacterium]
MDKVLKRHKRVFVFLRTLVSGTLKRIYRFHPEKADVGKGPFLITANHNGNLDPALALSFRSTCISFPASMSSAKVCFVAVDLLFRRLRASRA